MVATSLIHTPGLIGIDEAGRGPLAGPVVTAAVCLPPEFDISGINDSKQLTAADRELLAERIRKSARYAIAKASQEEIDRMNVLQATMLAMKRAYDALGMEGEVLIDGNKVPYGLVGRAVVKGDSKYACIAAASILAKTERDRLMTELAAQYPAYGFERHFGYSTPEHLAALAEHGPSKIHRMSFAPCQPDEQLCLIFSD